MLSESAKNLNYKKQEIIIMSLGKLYGNMSNTLLKNVKEHFYNGEDKENLIPYDFFLAAGVMNLYKETVIKLATEEKHYKIIPVCELYKVLREIRRIKEEAERMGEALESVYLPVLDK